jgi:hypothetical protein
LLLIRKSLSFSNCRSAKQIMLQVESERITEVVKLGAKVHCANDALHAYGNKETFYFASRL